MNSPDLRIFTNRGTVESAVVNDVPPEWSDERVEAWVRQQARLYRSFDMYRIALRDVPSPWRAIRTSADGTSRTYIEMPWGVNERY